MPATLSLFVLLVALCLTSLSTSVEAKGKLQVHPFFAATCLARSGNCNRFYQRWSGFKCRKFTIWTKQPASCTKMACPWCRRVGRRSRGHPCMSRAVMNACKLGGKSRKRNTKPKKNQRKQRPYFKKKTSSNNGKCVWTGSKNSIVIDLGKVALSKGWVRSFRNGMSGIMFMKSPYRGISPKGMIGKMCFSVRAPLSGMYYMTAVSYAPHPTEHNDVWVETSKGFELWQHGRRGPNASPGSWLKAYQNKGTNGMSEDFKTIDFNGHRFLVPNVVKGQTFRVCLAGRSLKYELYKMVLTKCGGMMCKGGIMTNMMNMKSSRCV